MPEQSLHELVMQSISRHECGSMPRPALNFLIVNNLNGACFVVMNIYCILQCAEQLSNEQ